MEERKEGVGGGEVELHTGFLSLTHGDGGPRVPGAAEERWVVLLEEVVALFPREEAGKISAKRGTPRPKRERGSDRMLGIQKLAAAFLSSVTRRWRR